MFIKMTHILACMLFFSMAQGSQHRPDNAFITQNADNYVPLDPFFNWRKWLPREQRIMLLQKDVNEIVMENERAGNDLSYPMLALEDFKRMLNTSDWSMNGDIDIADAKIARIASVLNLTPKPTPEYTFRL